MNMAEAIGVEPPLRGALQRLGDGMRRHASVIRIVQWAMVAFYLALVITPAFLPLPAQGASIINNLTLFAQFAFWGLWWPFVMVSTMLLGRVWCGVFCPEGALTELASRHGRGKTIPRWMRWSGWPVLAFLSTTVYGQLLSVYEYPKPALLILGGSTLAAVAIGFVYGKGKRVWCRYLCPATGVFGLLAKIAPLHFRADEEAWKRYPLRPLKVNCPTLVDMRHMKSASPCHACGRCSGHRNAIALELRSPNREILAARTAGAGTAEALLLVFGLLGLVPGAFQWSASPWFVALKQRAAEWLIAHDAFALLQDNAPWWLLTHYPTAGDVFTWLDGLAILAYIFGTTFALGGVVLLALVAASRLCGALDWRVLALGLVPVAAIGVFLGLSMLTLTQLRGEGVLVPYLREARAVLLATGVAWSGWLGLRLIFSSRAPRGRSMLAVAAFAGALAAAESGWYFLFFAW